MAYMLAIRTVIQNEKGYALGDIVCIRDDDLAMGSGETIDPNGANPPLFFKVEFPGVTAAQLMKFKAAWRTVVTTEPTVYKKRLWSFDITTFPTWAKDAINNTGVLSLVGATKRNQLASHLINKDTGEEADLG